jgi:hypothetical protein
MKSKEQTKEEESFVKDGVDKHHRRRIFAWYVPSPSWL